MAKFHKGSVRKERADCKAFGRSRAKTSPLAVISKPRISGRERPKQRRTIGAVGSTILEFVRVVAGLASLRKVVSVAGGQWRGNDRGALIDYSTVIDLQGAEHVAMALINRGVLKYKRTDYLGAEADYSRALTTENLEIDYRALALYNRGVVRKLLGNTEAALADYRSVIETPDAPACWVGQAHCNRAEIKVQQEDMGGACKDLQFALDLPGAPDEVVTYARARRKALACGP